MTLLNDVHRCLGERMTGVDCPRMNQCQRFTERASRAPTTPISWSLCHERDADFTHQIKLPVRGEVG